MKLLQMYRKMVKIRRFEKRVRDVFIKGKVSGFTHPYAGEEAIVIG